MAATTPARPAPLVNNSTVLIAQTTPTAYWLRFHLIIKLAAAFLDFMMQELQYVLKFVGMVKLL